MDRSGAIGLNLINNVDLVSGTTIGLTASDRYAIAQHKSRIGTEEHEVRWLPANDVGPWIWRADNQADVVPRANNSMQMIAINTESGALTFEVTIVWEWQPNLDVNYGVPNTITGPKSMVPMSSALAMLGDAVAWATRPQTIADTKRLFSGVATLGKVAAKAIATVL
jgi:hypothetical protein